jgi:two-component system, OmpR family, alkaline phosphatase synthesis response regulator PhoP
MAFKILVVDDEEGLVLLMQTNLEFAGYNVVTAFDGEQALERVAEEKPDLILLDIRMPKKNGWEVCRELKSKEETKAIPIIFLSAYAQREDVAKGLEMGAEKYMTKPADPKEVAEVIQGILNRRNPPA